MNKKPVSYLQTDARWKNKPYRVSGESSTIAAPDADRRRRPC